MLHTMSIFIFGVSAVVIGENRRRTSDVAAVKRGRLGRRHRHVTAACTRIRPKTSYYEFGRDDEALDRVLHTTYIIISYNIVTRREEEIGRLSTLSALQRIDVYTRASGTLQGRRQRGWQQTIYIYVYKCM